MAKTKAEKSADKRSFTEVDKGAAKGGAVVAPGGAAGSAPPAATKTVPPATTVVTTTKTPTSSIFTHGNAKSGVPLTPHAFTSKITVSGVPRVFIAPQALWDMYDLVDMCSVEISWLGLVEEIGRDFYVSEIFLIEQDCHPAETEMSAEGLATLTLKVMDERGMDVANSLRFWGHSHVNMGTGPSGTDESTMKMFEDGGHPYTIRAILNKDGRMEMGVFLYDKGIVVKDAPWEVFVAQEDRDARRKVLREEMKELVTRVSPGTTTFYRGQTAVGGDVGHGGYQNGYDYGGSGYIYNDGLEDLNGGVSRLYNAWGQPISGGIDEPEKGTDIIPKPGDVEDTASKPENFFQDHAFNGGAKT